MTLNHTRPAATQFAPIRRLDIASEKQASWPVANGLGVLGLLHDIWFDSTWWVLESTADRFAVLTDGLLIMIHVGRGRDALGHPIVASFATPDELQRINLRALQAAVASLWTFPDVLRDVSLAKKGEREALKQALLAPQLLLWAQVRSRTGFRASCDSSASRRGLARDESRS